MSGVDVFFVSFRDFDIRKLVKSLLRNLVHTTFRELRPLKYEERELLSPQAHLILIYALLSLFYSRALDGSPL